MNVITILCDTLRRDHCSAYTGGKPLNQCWSKEAPDWAVPTPNMQRLADRGTTFNHAWCGSTPCMPARRDIYTGIYEFLHRGWGPLEEGDLDLPRAVSGPPNRSITAMREQGLPVSQLFTDHFHLWEQGSGNYHMGYTGFEFIRGMEADNYLTDPIDLGDTPNLHNKIERHERNMKLTRFEEKDWTCAKLFTKAADWLHRNHTHDSFYMHLDCFPPHEPLDPPEDILKQFWPEGYSNPEDVNVGWPYADWREAGLTERQMQFARARYAANVVLVDRWLGKLFDAMDDLDLWRNTVVIFTTDHGTYNGDHGRLGKLQTHQHDACGHLPFIMHHPEHGHGETRDQLVQLVDIYPTVLSALNRPLPEGAQIDGIDLLPVMEDANAKTRDYAIAGQFGKSISITDGRWILHQSPVAENQPLNWYGCALSKFLSAYTLGDYENGRRAAETRPWPAPTWLSDKQDDPNELQNIAKDNPKKVHELQNALSATLRKVGAPPEQLTRLGLE